jgi:hypothetical protein
MVKKTTSKSGKKAAKGAKNVGAKKPANKASKAFKNHHLGSVCTEIDSK